MKEDWIYWEEEKSRLALNERGLHLPEGEKRASVVNERGLHLPGVNYVRLFL